jgi:tRNA A-37 threonylcarbamoyl transferase component Bud32
MPGVRGERKTDMVGEMVMDRFRLEERIGSGGMGTVYKAFDERLQRHVAVKEVMVGSPDRVAREAQAAARLNHPGIVSLFEFGIDGHRALLVSELISGQTLDALAREGALCDRDVAELGADVCEALGHAHDRGVVHRDIKPQNVIARDDAGAGRRAKLTDFGIASLTGAPTLTAPGEVVGTLAYMSPEQAEGEKAGPASDVYSLALTLYECWSGENPVRRSSPAQTARAMGEPLPPLSEYRPDLPARLCAAIDACLEPDAAERPALEYLRHSLESAIPDLDCDYAVPAPAAAALPAEERTPASEGLLRTGLALGLAAACVVLAGPAGMPGVALLAALLCFPAIAFASRPERAGLPAATLVLGAVSAGGAYPALVAAAERTPLSRFALGALGWWWLVAGCAALGVAPPAGLMDPPATSWDASLGTAVDALIVPVLSLESLAGMAAFGAGAAILGRVLESAHLAMAAFGSLVWAAGMTAALRVVGDGGLHWAPLVIAASALAALAFEHRARSPRAPFARRHETAPAPAQPAPTAG